MCAVGSGVRGRREKSEEQGGTLWSARNTHSTKENRQLPASQISFMGMDQLPTVDFGHRSYPRMFARCLTHEGRNTVSGFLPHPDP